MTANTANCAATEDAANVPGHAANVPGNPANGLAGFADYPFAADGLLGGPGEALLAANPFHVPSNVLIVALVHSFADFPVVPANVLLVADSFMVPSNVPVVAMVAPVASVTPASKHVSADASSADHPAESPADAAAPALSRGNFGFFFIQTNPKAVSPGFSVAFAVPLPGAVSSVSLRGTLVVAMRLVSLRCALVVTFGDMFAMALILLPVAAHGLANHRHLGLALRNKCDGIGRADSLRDGLEQVACSVLRNNKSFTLVAANLGGPDENGNLVTELAAVFGGDFAPVE